MDLSSVSLIWWLLLLVLINIVAVATFRNADRFWHPPIIIWLSLFFTLVLLQVDFSNTFDLAPVVAEHQKAQEGKTADAGPAAVQNEQPDLWDLKIFRLLGAQSFIGLFLLTVAYQQSGSRRFRQGALTFAGLSLLYLVLEIIMMFTGFLL